MDPTVVAEALRLGLLQPGEADGFLNPPPLKPPFLVPATPPPPERLVLIKRPDGRLRRTRQRMTKALIRAGVIDPAVVAERHPPLPAPPPAECDNGQVNGFERMIMQDAENGVDQRNYDSVWTAQPKPGRDRTIPAAPLNWVPPDEEPAT